MRFLVIIRNGSVEINEFEVQRRISDCLGRQSSLQLVQTVVSIIKDSLNPDYSFCIKDDYSAKHLEKEKVFGNEPGQSTQEIMTELQSS